MKSSASWSHEADPMQEDILDQPRALIQTLRTLQDHPAIAAVAQLVQQGAEVVLTGMGASYFACYPTWLRLLQAGVHAVWIEAGELLHFAPELAGRRSLIIAVSQSGRTAELVHLLPLLRDGCVLVAVTADGESPLAKAAQITVPVAVGAEQAGCATKTFTGALCALDLLAEGMVHGRCTAALALWEQASTAIAQALAERQGWMDPLLQALGAPAHLWLVGRGPGVAAASCGALLVKEASRVHAEGMSCAQYRHGPLEAAGPGGAGVVLITPGPLGSLDLQLAAEMAAAGMPVAAVLLGEAPDLPASVVPVSLPAVAPTPAPALQILPAQLLGRALALRQGRIPGRFTRIGKVTERE